MLEHLQVLKNFTPVDLLPPGQTLLASAAELEVPSRPPNPLHQRISLLRRPRAVVCRGRHASSDELWGCG
eukprot:1375060-Rhodomonas_salina.2